jgi:hypothetical protein
MPTEDGSGSLLSFIIALVTVWVDNVSSSGAIGSSSMTGRMDSGFVQQQSAAATVRNDNMRFIR